MLDPLVREVLVQDRVLRRVLARRLVVVLVAALERDVAPLPRGSYRLLALPAERALAELARQAARFDLVFADPPYSWVPDAGFLAACSLLLRSGGVLTIEHSARSALPASAGDLVRTDSRRYGESALAFYGKTEF